MKINFLTQQNMKSCSLLPQVVLDSENCDKFKKHLLQTDGRKIHQRPLSPKIQLVAQRVSLLEIA